MRISPVIHPKDGVADPNSRTFWSAVANALYILRQPGEDLFGATPDFNATLAAGNDLVAHGRRGPLGCDSGDLAGLGIWAAADQAATVDRPSDLIGWLPPDLTETAWRELVLRFLDNHSVANGMVADWAIHSLADGGGGWIRNPHFHAILNHRFYKPGARFGQPNPAWLAMPKARAKMADAWTVLTSAARS